MSRSWAFASSIAVSWSMLNAERSFSLPWFRFGTNGELGSRRTRAAARAAERFPVLKLAGGTRRPVSCTAGGCSGREDGPAGFGKNRFAIDLSGGKDKSLYTLTARMAPTGTGRTWPAASHSADEEQRGGAHNLAALNKKLSLLESEIEGLIEEGRVELGRLQEGQRAHDDAVCRLTLALSLEEQERHIQDLEDRLESSSYALSLLEKYDLALSGLQADSCAGLRPGSRRGRSVSRRLRASFKLPRTEPTSFPERCTLLRRHLRKDRCSRRPARSI